MRIVARDRLSNFAWERRLGISTHGVVPIDNPDSVHYATMSYSTVWPMLRHLDLQPSDVFVDIGCGKGRVLCCAARSDVRQVVGVDLSPALCRQARANATRLHGRRAPIRVETAFAQEYDYSDATAVFMFCPFGAETMESVLAKLEHDTDGHELRIAYANPVHDALLRQQSWLQCTDFWERGENGLEHSISFYRRVD